MNTSSYNFVSTDFNTRLLTLLMFCVERTTSFASSAKSHSHAVSTFVNPINAILQVVCIVCSTLHKCTTCNVRRKSCLITSIFLFKLIQTYFCPFCVALLTFPVVYTVAMMVSHGDYFLSLHHGFHSQPKA